MNAKNVFVKSFKSIFYSLEGALVIALGVFSVLLSNSIAWMFDTWNHLTMDELVYQLNSPIEGTSEEIIREYVNYCIPVTVLALVFIIIFIIVFHKRKKLYHIGMAVILACSVLLTGYFLNMTWVRLDIANYSKNKSTYSTFIEDNYVDANDVELRFPEKKRNLIYIYLESMETTFSDMENGGAFEVNYIPELTELAQEYEDFSGTESILNGGYSMPQTTWTVAAMFAQTAGLPLSIPLEHNEMNTQDSFFAGTTTLGNVLQDAGYSQTLLIGSDATFGGRRLLFSGHGDFTIHDYNYALDEGLIPKGYRVWWGYEDKRLFQFAKRELRTLAQQEEPFNLTILTVDTHKEDGYLCDDCENTFRNNQYANVLACSSKTVSEFVRWVQRQDFYENTTIVLAGDHPTMDSDFCDDVAYDYTRKVYTVYINPAAEVQRPDVCRDYTTFDHYPTTLASLGVEIEGERLGLGTNLFSDEWTLTEKYQRGWMETELNRKSKFMNQLTSYIDPDRRPEAQITVGDYDEMTAVLPITISDIQNVQGRLRALNVAVWTKEDQSDLQWMQAQENEDREYVMNIGIGNFGYETAEYNIHVYGVLTNGSMVMLGGVEEQIERTEETGEIWNMEESEGIEGIPENEEIGGNPEAEGIGENTGTEERVEPEETGNLPVSLGAQ